MATISQMAEDPGSLVNEPVTTDNRWPVVKNSLYYL
jgi:hypothetical protein